MKNKGKRNTKNSTIVGGNRLVDLVEFLIEMNEEQKTNLLRTTKPNSGMTLLGIDGEEVTL